MKCSTAVPGSQDFERVGCCEKNRGTPPPKLIGKRRFNRRFFFVERWALKDGKKSWIKRWNVC